MGKLYGAVAFQPCEKQVTVLFFQNGIAKDASCKHTACQGKIIIQHRVVKKNLLKLGADLALGQGISHAVLGKIVNKLHSCGNVMMIKPHFLHDTAAGSFQAFKNIALPEDFHINFPEIMHPDIFCRKPDCLIIFFLGNGGHQP
ncbi:hypothetical protein IMSAG249_00936 [Lachnospiraceae bacterium]|nr:hypothetical protein IMSAG249_00936 [Lachnospiraceae bacterium]